MRRTATVGLLLTCFLLSLFSTASFASMTRNDFDRLLLLTNKIQARPLALAKNLKEASAEDYVYIDDAEIAIARRHLDLFLAESQHVFALHQAIIGFDVLCAMSQQYGSKETMEAAKEAFTHYVTAIYMQHSSGIKSSFREASQDKSPKIAAHAKQSLKDFDECEGIILRTVERK